MEIVANFSINSGDIKNGSGVCVPRFCGDFRGNHVPDEKHQEDPAGHSGTECTADHRARSFDYRA